MFRPYCLTSSKFCCEKMPEVRLDGLGNHTLNNNLFIKIFFHFFFLYLNKKKNRFFLLDSLKKKRWHQKQNLCFIFVALSLSLRFFHRPVEWDTYHMRLELFWFIFNFNGFSCLAIVLVNSIILKNKELKKNLN